MLVAFLFPLFLCFGWFFGSISQLSILLLLFQLLRAVQRLLFLFHFLDLQKQLLLLLLPLLLLLFLLILSIHIGSLLNWQNLEHFSPKLFGEVNQSFYHHFIYQLCNIDLLEFWELLLIFAAFFLRSSYVNTNNYHPVVILYHDDWGPALSGLRWDSMHHVASFWIDVQNISSSCKPILFDTNWLLAFHVVFWLWISVNRKCRFLLIQMRKISDQGKEARIIHFLLEFE